MCACVCIFFYRCYISMFLFVCYIVNGIPFMFWCLCDMHFDLFLPFTCFERILCYRFHSDILLLNFEHFLYICTKRVVVVLGLSFVFYLYRVSCVTVSIFSASRCKCVHRIHKHINNSKWTGFWRFFMDRMWSGHGHDTSLQSYRTCTHILSYVTVINTECGYSIWNSYLLHKTGKNVERTH